MVPATADGAGPQMILLSGIQRTQNAGAMQAQLQLLAPHLVLSLLQHQHQVATRLAVSAEVSGKMSAMALATADGAGARTTPQSGILRTQNADAKKAQARLLAQHLNRVATSLVRSAQTSQLESAMALVTADGAGPGMTQHSGIQRTQNADASDLPTQTSKSCKTNKLA